MSDAFVAIIERSILYRKCVNMVAIDLMNIEHEIGVRCRVAWPYTESKPLSFQRSVGTTFNRDRKSRCELPEFPISLLRNETSTNYFFDKHVKEIQKHVKESWCLEIDYNLQHVTGREMLPSIVYGSTIGSFATDDLMRLKEFVVEAVDYAWCGLQASYVESLAAEVSTGVCGSFLDDLYKQQWFRKDGPNRRLQDIDSRLFAEYRELAKAKLRQDDLEMAAQYSQICLNLAVPDSGAEHAILREFSDFPKRWNTLTVRKENSVKKRATVAREGIAVFWRLKMSDMGRSGKIHSLTKEFGDFLRIVDIDMERAKITGKSPSNPYRRGFEIAEEVDQGLGSVALKMWGIITEWPLEEVRTRVPAYVVEKLQGDSPLAPDLRSKRLAELAQDSSKLFTSRADLLPSLRRIGERLDGSIPGIATCALCQLESEKGL